MKKVVLATSNPGKVREFDELFIECNMEVISQTVMGVDPVEETGLTFIENAILKARHAAQITSLPAIADDSGLAVDALFGAPGIYSARYAGADASDEQNRKKLLAALKDVPCQERTAHFHCVLAYLRSADDPIPLIFHGTWSGEISRNPMGHGGFGYDPIFLLPNRGCTAAELSQEEKKKLSHRGKALKMMLEVLRNVD